MGRAFEYRKAAKLKRWGNMARTFTRIGKQIAIAVKSGGPDPETNPHLRAIIANAKHENMPKDNIERAIKNALGKDQKDYKEVTYEGYGPHGIAIFVDAATDNTTRTVANVRSVFNKFGGTLGTSGSLAFMFTQKCVFTFAKPADLDMGRLQRNLGYLTDFAEKNQLTAVLLAVPSPGYMLEDKLPNMHEEYMDEQAFAVIRETLTSSIAFVDMRETFRNASEQIYYRTDHHITSAGSYACYRALCNALAITATEKDAYTIEVSDGFYGTTYSRSGLWLEKADTVEMWKNDKLSVTVWVSEDGSEATAHDGIFFTDHLNEDDQYPVFLDGNHGYTHIHNENADGGKVLIIKDSYAHCMTGFLAEHYSDIYMIDLRYYKLELTSLVQEQGIDTVLYIYGIDNLASDSNIAWLA